VRGDVGGRRGGVAWRGVAWRGVAAWRRGVAWRVQSPLNPIWPCGNASGMDMRLSASIIYDI
jgi:hypothetical protein